MRKMILLALAAVVASVAVPAAAYYMTKPGDDALGETLRSYGFLPIKPPSNLMNVGSLYYVDASARSFTPICDVAKADIDTLVARSRSWDMQETLERDGNFATNVKVDFRSVVKGGGDAAKNYVQKVHASLTDIMLEEIPLGPSWVIFGKMMERPECNKIAMDYVYSSGYVCQGQKLLQATAEFKFNLDANSKLATEAKVALDEVKDKVKLAVEAQSNQAVVEREGRLFAGKALQYGVLMNPTCLAPAHAHFRRVLPRTAWDRAVNFMLFNVIEPMLPARHNDTAVAQGSRTTTAQ
jgi:hypothetical protein